MSVHKTSLEELVQMAIPKLADTDAWDIAKHQSPDQAYLSAKSRGWSDRDSASALCMAIIKRDYGLHELAQAVHIARLMGMKSQKREPSEDLQQLLGDAYKHLECVRLLLENITRHPQPLVQEFMAIESNRAKFAAVVISTSHIAEQTGQVLSYSKLQDV